MQKWQKELLAEAKLGEDLLGRPIQITSFRSSGESGSRSFSFTTRIDTVAYHLVSGEKFLYLFLDMATAEHHSTPPFLRFSREQGWAFGFSLDEIPNLKAVLSVERLDRAPISGPEQIIN